MWNFKKMTCPESTFHPLLLLSQRFLHNHQTFKHDFQAWLLSSSYILWHWHSLSFSTSVTAAASPVATFVLSLVSLQFALLTDRANKRPLKSPRKNGVWVKEKYVGYRAEKPEIDSIKMESKPGCQYPKWYKMDRGYMHEACGNLKWPSPDKHDC